MTPYQLPTLLLVLTLCAGCGEEPTLAPGGGDARPVAPADAHATPPDAAHAVAPAGGHVGAKADAHSVAEALGTLEVAGFGFTITQESALAAGKEIAFDITTDKANAPEIIRAWIGEESGAGSRKARLQFEKDRCHAHVEAPAALAETSRLWFEVELDSGKETAAIDLHR